MIFDGKAFAEEIISKLPKKTAKLAIFLDPNNAGGVKYVERKTKLAERLGVQVQVSNPNSQIPINDQISNIKSQIEELNNDDTVTGIMIQLPLGFGALDLEIASVIKREKDVDGLREDSPFLPAAVLAIQKILTSPSVPLLSLGEGCKGEVLIVGSHGFIGRKLIKVLGARYSVSGMDKEDFDPEKNKTFDIVISATGQEGLIKDIKEGAICIDLGFPKGDFDPKLAEKASFFTPVPGGVGPVTVACLFANLLGE